MIEKKIGFGIILCLFSFCFFQGGGEVIFVVQIFFFMFILLQKLLLNTKHGLNGKKKNCIKALFLGHG